MTDNDNNYLLKAIESAIEAAEKMEHANSDEHRLFIYKMWCSMNEALEFFLDTYLGLVDPSERATLLDAMRKQLQEEELGVFQETVEKMQKEESKSIPTVTYKGKKVLA